MEHASTVFPPTTFTSSLGCKTVASTYAGANYYDPCTTSMRVRHQITCWGAVLLIFMCFKLDAVEASNPPPPPPPFPGRAFTWGSNTEGVLGIGHTVRTPRSRRPRLRRSLALTRVRAQVAVWTPTLTTGGVDLGFVEVAAGSSFAFGRAADGSMYSWGGNLDGQLALNDNGADSPSCPFVFRVRNFCIFDDSSSHLTPLHGSGSANPDAHRRHRPWGRTLGPHARRRGGRKTCDCVE